MKGKYTTDDVVVMLNGKQCVGFGEYTDSETQLLVNDGFMQMARNVNELLQQRAELLKALKELLSEQKKPSTTGFIDICVVGGDVINALNAIQKAEQ